MTKQLESIHLHHTAQLRNIVFFLCLTTSISLQDTLAQNRQQTNQITSQQIPSIFDLNTLVPWPYTYEWRIGKLEKDLVFICTRLKPQQKVLISTILSSQTATQGYIWSNGIPYNEFVAWRTATDNIRKEQKTQFMKHAHSLGYTQAQMYSIHQLVSFLRQEWQDNNITIINSEFFDLITQLQKTYSISGKEWIRTYIQNNQFNQWQTKLSSSIKKSEDRHPVYRIQPTQQTTIYGNTPINMLHYDWNTASRKIHNIWYNFWSSILQEEENGQHYVSWFSCVEWITQDALDWLQTLYTALKKLNNWKPISVYINWWTEWYDHRMGNSIIAWYVKPWIDLLPEHSKAHGAGYTVDIRLSGDAALLLKSIFKYERWKTSIWNTVYEYLFHGNWTGYHLHLNMFSPDTYTKLFTTTNKD